MTQPNFKDETGNKYGKLTVIERARNTIYGTAKWLCQCECGNTKECRGQDLRSGRITHCGCENKLKKITNYFKIKNMSVDEMVLFLNSCEYCTLWGTGCDCEKDCEKGITEWLMQEVEE
jgi:hypothetical protein